MKALIVDDDAVNREILKAILAPYGDIHTAEDGSQCLEIFMKALHTSPFQLICLDIMMPGMDGHAVLKEIRDAERERGIGWEALVKVIMTTALADQENIKKAFIIGKCEAYLTKPIEQFTLIEQVRKLGIPLRTIEV